MRAVVMNTLILAVYGLSTARGEPTANKSGPLVGAQRFTLGEVFAAAVRTAPQLEQAVYVVEQAEGQAMIADGATDWVLTIAGVVNRSVTPPDDLRPETTRIDGSGSIGLRRLLPTNGVFELLTNSRKSVIVNNPAATSVSTGATIRLTQPLLKGFGGTPYRAPLDQAAHRRDAESIRRAAAARGYAVAVITAYWNLALAWRQLEVRRTGLDNANKQLTLYQKAGRVTLAKSDLIPLEQAAVQRELDTVAAERDIVTRSIELRSLCGLELDPAHIAIQTVELAAPPRPPKLELVTVLEKALANSDDVRATLAELAAARIGADAAARGALPRLDLALEAGVVGIDRKFVDSVNALGDAKDYTVSAGLTFELPIGQHANRGAEAVARTAATRARFDVANARATVTASVTQAYYAVLSQAAAIELAAKVVELADANLTAEKTKFEFGKSSTNEIVQRETELEQARLARNSSTATYLIALAQLEALVGDILTTNQIKLLEPATVIERRQRAN